MPRGRFASLLSATDDDAVDTVYGPGAGGDPTAETAVDRVVAGGSTNLSGGWPLGRRLVEQGRVEGTNRVVLLSDGQAKVGVVEPERLLGLTGSGAARRDRR